MNLSLIRARQAQRGSTFLGIILGVVVGLAAALGVAIYVAKVPVPFVNKNTSRTSGQDAAEAQKNRDWDPNAPLRLARTNKTQIHGGITLYIRVGANTPSTDRPLCNTCAVAATSARRAFFTVSSSTRMRSAS